MNFSPSPHDEFGRLLGRLLDSDLSPGEREQFSRLLSEDDEARRYYVRVAALHARLLARCAPPVLPLAPIIPGCVGIGPDLPGCDFGDLRLTWLLRLNNDEAPSIERGRNAIHDELIRCEFRDELIHRLRHCDRTR